MAQHSSAKASQKHTLVMLSGGIDSTAALWYVLNKPVSYGQVHVHHIHIQNIEARWKAEAKAVSAVLAYLHKHAPSPFTASESSINTPYFGNKFLFDAEVLGFITGYMTSRDPLIHKVIIGATGTDFAAGVSPGVETGKRIHNAFHSTQKDNGALLKEFPMSDKTKEEVYKTLPPELAVLTWSCRTPRYVGGRAIECGRCKTCILELRSIKRPQAAAKRIPT